MMIVDGQAVYTDAEQAVANYYDKKVDKLIALKDKFLNLMSEVRYELTVNTFDFDDALITMEQEFDDLVYAEFCDAKDESGSIEEMPTSTAYKNWLREQEIAKQNKEAAKSSGEHFIDALNTITFSQIISEARHAKA